MPEGQKQNFQINTPQFQNRIKIQPSPINQTDSVSILVDPVILSMQYLFVWKLVSTNQHNQIAYHSIKERNSTQSSKWPEKVEQSKLYSYNYCVFMRQRFQEN